jgi:hypothetical protein
MKCYANKVATSLLNIPGNAPVAVTTEGTPYRVLPDGQDRLMDDTQDYRFVISLDFAGGANAPTAQVVIQGSIDKATWLDLAPGAIRTTAGSYREILDAPSVPMLPWIRARLVLGGGTPPNVSATADLVSTGPFQLSTT